MKLRCSAEINGQSIEHNLRYLRSRIDPHCQIVAVVKDNGFGHGMLPVTNKLLTLGVEGLGIAHVHEAVEMRAAKIKAPLILFSAALPSEYPEILRLQAIPMISTLAEAKTLAQVARKSGVIAEAHFKIDTGMGRLGLWGQQAIEELHAVLKLPHLRIGAVATHLARADDDLDFTRHQIKAFTLFRKEFPHLPYHFANSAAACLKLAGDSPCVRVGLALYGIPPLRKFTKSLKPALTWQSRITLIRELAPGRTISYGATYRTRRTETLATVAVGYGDGYSRALSNCGEVLIGGKRCPIRGRVTMDQIIVDITKVPTAKVEDEVVLIGRQGKDEITADELASRAKTISYEILTSISPRVPRVYVKW